METLGFRRRKLNDSFDSGSAVGQNRLYCIRAEPVCMSIRSLVPAIGQCPYCPVMGASGLQSTIGALMTRRQMHRRKAAISQSHLCFYCRSPMWETESELPRFAARHGLQPTQAELLRCTAEHLKPRSEGGTDAANNIVAACLYCNRSRHQARVPLESERFRQRVSEPEFAVTYVKRIRALTPILPTSSPASSSRSARRRRSCRGERQRRCSAPGGTNNAPAQRAGRADRYG
jgi:hypothetical protein